MSQLPALKSRQQMGKATISFPESGGFDTGTDAKSPDAYRSSSAHRIAEKGRPQDANGMMQGNRAMSQTFTKLPQGRVPPLDKVLSKIKEGQRKQLKVLRAQLQKKDRN